jgi:ubiquinone/menaquinone biosynthesis C-methylase UbiE
MTSQKTEPEYVHGYTATEQQRLVDQAQFLSRYLFRDIDFHEQHHIIEMGCGVGAQSKILLDKFPRLKISGVDISKIQLEKANIYLKNEIAQERISLHHTDGKKVPFARETFDGAYLCWILEHTTDPNAVLQETRRTLKPGALIYVTEVYNSTLFLYPECPHTLNY